MSHAMETGERILSRNAFGTAWQHSHPTLLVANVPTAIFVAASHGRACSTPIEPEKDQSGLSWPLIN